MAFPLSLLYERGELGEELIRTLVGLAGRSGCLVPHRSRDVLSP